MLLHQTSDTTKYQDVVNTRGNVYYIKNGTIYKNNPGQAVMVSGSGDLTALADYPPGTIAYTAGFASMWQLSATGTWVEV